MPWTSADVDKHKKGLTAKQKRQWVHVANGALRRGLSEGAAVREANRTVGRPKRYGYRRR